jgi:SAM-dependent methyltransferase
VKAKPWYENNDFWTTVRPFMFAPDRIAAAGEQVDSIIKLSGIKPGARVLDLCCGVGRHSLEFARRGYRVTGVDRTASYLAEARKQARKEGLSIEFVQRDMRRFTRPNAFDLALNLFTSFGYFANPQDDARVVRNVYRSLAPHGVLEMEMSGKEWLARRFTERDWYEKAGYTVLEERKIHPGWSGITNRWIVYKGGRRHEFKFDLRLYSAVELTNLLRSVGFRKVTAYGDLAGAPYDHTAQRLTVIARK